MTTSRDQFNKHQSLTDRHINGLAGDRHMPVLVDRRVEELRPHPRYVELCSPVGEHALFEMAKLGNPLFDECLVVADSGIILDGYKRWLLARKQARTHVLCLQYTLENDTDVLSLLVELHLRKTQFPNDFQRIVLALELEPMLQAKAKERQRVGGREKVSSDLTNDARIDVRREIARRAMVSAGNVAKRSSRSWQKAVLTFWLL